MKNKMIVASLVLFISNTRLFFFTISSVPILFMNAWIGAGLSALRPIKSTGGVSKRWFNKFHWKRSYV
jgi:hypothetical protein